MKQTVDLFPTIQHMAARIEHHFDISMAVASGVIIGIIFIIFKLNTLLGESKDTLNSFKLQNQLMAQHDTAIKELTKAITELTLWLKTHNGSK